MNNIDIISSAQDYAAYIVARCQELNAPVNNLRLQHILYLLQKRSFAQTGRPAFYDDFEAWQTGPVVPNVYYRYCQYGAMPITPYKPSLPGNVNDELAEAIMRDYIHIPVWELAKLSQDAAWETVYAKGNKQVIFMENIKPQQKGVF